MSKKNKLFVKDNGVRSHIIDLFVSVVSLVLDVVIFNVLGNVLSEYNLWSIAVFIVLFVFFAFVIIWFIATRFITQIHYPNEYELVSQCLYNNTKCCGIDVCKNIAENYVFNLSEENEAQLQEEYSLYLKEQVVKKEINFKECGGKEIWIISTDLDSEITNKGLPSYVKDNLDNDIKYNFVFLKNECATVMRNKQKILEGLTKPENVVFYPLGISESDLNTYIVYLFGIVIYEYDKYNYEGYFSLRNYANPQQIEPIYLKMPQCMADQYIDIFHSIQSQQKPQCTPDQYIDVFSAVQNNPKADL